MDANAVNTNGNVLAKEVMTTEIISVLPETPVKEVARLMIDNKISAIPVVTKYNEIVGVVSENDLINKVVRPNEPGIMTLLYHAAFTAPAICVSPEDTIESVGRVMLDDKVKRVFVAEEGHLLGVISRSVFVELLLKE